MRLDLETRLPEQWDRARMAEIVRDIGQQVNRHTEGKVKAVTNADTAAPTAGTYLQGDFVRNSTPSEAGAGGSKYVIFGWLCTVTGTPGTWVACRFLTGN